MRATAVAYSDGDQPADARDHGDAELAETGQVVGAERVEAGIREPDRVHHSRGRLGDPHRRVALARVQGDRLRHERPQAERSGRERVERARAVHERVWERDAAEVDAQVRRGHARPLGVWESWRKSWKRTGPVWRRLRE